MSVFLIHYKTGKFGGNLCLLLLSCTLVGEPRGEGDRTLFLANVMSGLVTFIRILQNVYFIILFRTFRLIFKRF